MVDHDDHGHGEKGQWNRSIASLHSKLIKDSRNEANLRCDSGWISASILD